MATITVTEPHNRDPREVVTQVQALMGDLEARYAVRCAWQDERTALFDRGGISGELAIGEREVTVSLRLGMMMAAFGSRIECELRQAMRRRLAP